MNRVTLLRLEALRRRLEADLTERRSKEYTEIGMVEVLRKIRTLEAEPLRMRAPLPSEDEISRSPVHHGPTLERALRAIQDVHTAVTNYNWGRRP